MRKVGTNGKRTWVEIDTKALKHNFGVFRRLATASRRPERATASRRKKTLLAPVIKSNAYGHGLLECGKLFAKWGADMLCVDDIDEALGLRGARVRAPILVLGYVLDIRMGEARRN